MFEMLNHPSASTSSLSTKCISNHDQLFTDTTTRTHTLLALHFMYAS